MKWKQTWTNQSSSIHGLFWYTPSALSDDFTNTIIATGPIEGRVIEFDAELNRCFDAGANRFNQNRMSNSKSKRNGSTSIYSTIVYGKSGQTRSKLRWSVTVYPSSGCKPDEGSLPAISVSDGVDLYAQQPAHYNRWVQPENGVFHVPSLRQNVAIFTCKDGFADDAGYAASVTAISCTTRTQLITR